MENILKTLESKKESDEKGKYIFTILSQCLGKPAYRTKTRCLKGVKHIISRAIEDDKPIHFIITAYSCPHCDKWHIGSEMGRALFDKRLEHSSSNHWTSNLRMAIHKRRTLLARYNTKIIHIENLKQNRINFKNTNNIDVNIGLQMEEVDDIKERIRLLDVLIAEMNLAP